MPFGLAFLPWASGIPPPELGTVLLRSPDWRNSLGRVEPEAGRARAFWVRSGNENGRQAFGPAGSPRPKTPKTRAPLETEPSDYPPFFPSPNTTQPLSNN